MIIGVVIYSYLRAVKDAGVSPTTFEISTMTKKSRA